MSVADQERLAEGAPTVRVGLVLTAVAATLLFASLGQTIVSTAMPVMVADLGGVDHITWVLTAYLLASTIAAPVSGKLGDLFGRKVVMQCGIGIFVIGAAICGFAQDMGMLIAGRAIQGLGGGGLVVVSMAVVADVLPPRERGRAQGLMGAAFGVSTVVGPLVGGFLVDALSWHWIFFVNFPVGLLAFAILGVALETPPGKARKRLDYAGAGLLAAVLSVAVIGANLGGSVLPWGSAGFLGLVALGIVTLAGFILAEKRAEEPILPLGLFRNNTFIVVNGVGFMVGVAMFGTIAFIPLYLQVVQGVTPAVSGLFLTPMMVGLIASSAAAGQLMARTGRYKLLPTLSTGLLALTMIVLAMLEAGSPLWLVGAAMVFVGIGLGPVFSIGVTAIQNALPQRLLGVGTASANMFRLIGGSVGTAAFGAIFGAGLTRNIGDVLPAGTSLRSISAEILAGLPPETQAQVTGGFAQALHPIFWTGAAVAAAACVLSMLLKELPLDDRVGEA